jgi:hypothetical protein
MRLSGVLLAILLVAACSRHFTTVGKTSYTPKWRVGDWWMTKALWERPSGLGNYWKWDLRRYDVAGIKKVGQNDCYLVEMRSVWGTDTGSSGEPHRILFVRADSWLLIREAEARVLGGKRKSWDIINYPGALFGPGVGEPRLPRFPLQLASQDTAFKLETRRYGVADMREISSLADPGQVERLLAEGDTVGSLAIRPRGAVYQVRSELGGNRDASSPTGRKSIRQSLQFWSDDLPWRVFEELVGYSGSYGDRRVVERSWLIAVGHKKK